MIEQEKAQGQASPEAPAPYRQDEPEDAGLLSEAQFAAFESPAEAPETEAPPPDAQLGGAGRNEDGLIGDLAQRGFSGTGGEIPYRAEMEAAFGRSFAHVGAFSDAAAAEACAGLDAHAYTLGANVAFDSPNPDRGTVAHELTHVLQQDSAALQAKPATVSAPGDAQEVEADRLADRVVAGEDVAGEPVSTASDARVSRRPFLNQKYDLEVEETFNRVKIKAGFKLKPRGSGNAETGLATSVLENKAALSRGARDWTKKFSTTLLRVELSESITVPGFETMKVKADVKAFEAKVANLKGDDLDLDVLKVAVSYEGPIPVFHDVDLIVKGSAEVPVTAEDLARLTTVSRESRKAAKLTQQLAKDNDTWARLEKKAAGLRKRLAKLEERAGRPLYERQKQRLLAEIGANNKARLEVVERMVENGKAVKTATEAIEAAARGLKGGAGKLAVKGLVKSSSKILAKIGAKLVPGLNVVSTIADMVELGILLHDLAIGKQRIDPAGGGETDSGGVEGGDVTAEGEATDVEGDGGGDGSGEAGGDGEVCEEGDATGEEPAVELHPGAQAVFDLIGGGGDGEPRTAAEMETLNDLIPRDLTEAEIEQLHERLAGAASTSGGDAYAAIGALREEIERIREGDPESKLVIDGREYVDTPEGDIELAPEEQANEPPPPSLSPGDPIKLIGWDAKKDAVVWVDGEPDASKERTFTLGDGLEVALVDAQLETERKTEGDTDIIIAQVAVTHEVRALPPHADESYPWKVGDLDAEVFLFYYDVNKGAGGTLTYSDAVTSGLRQALVRRGQAWEIKKAGMLVNVGVATVAADEIVSQEQSAEQGATRHTLVVRIRPQEIHSRPALINTADGAMVDLESLIASEAARTVDVQISFQTMP